MSMLGDLNIDADFFQHESNFNFVSLNGLGACNGGGNKNIGLFDEDIEYDAFNGNFDYSAESFYSQDEYSGRGLECSFEASIAVKSDSRCARYVDIFEDAASFEDSFNMVPCKIKQLAVVKNSTELKVTSTDVVVEIPAKCATSIVSVRSKTEKEVKCDDRHVHTMLFKDVAHASVAPTHFTVNRFNKEAVLYTIRDHCDSNGLSYTYSPADSTHHVTAAAAEGDTDDGCEFTVRLYATEECDEGDKSAYVVEVSRLYGSQYAFSHYYSALRAFLLHDASVVVSKGGDEKNNDTSCVTSGASEFYSQPRNKIALAEDIYIPSLTIGAAVDGEQNSQTEKLVRDTRLRGATNLCAISRDQSMVDILLELDVVSQLLCIFRDCDAKNNKQLQQTEKNDKCNDSDAVKDDSLQGADASHADLHELRSTAVKALRNLVMHSQRVQDQLAGDKPFLSFVYGQVEAAQQQKGDGASAGVNAVSRDILRKLSVTHHDQICSLLGVRDLKHLVAATRRDSRRGPPVAPTKQPQQQPTVVKRGNQSGAGGNSLKLQRPLHVFADAMMMGGGGGVGLGAAPLRAIPTK